jgi:plasmid stabilization system protein ParE
VIEFHPAAAEESFEAYHWYRERSDWAAETFMQELDSAVEAIADAPSRYPVYLWGTRYYFLKRFPYLVIYRTMEDERVQVIAVAHGKRLRGYWKARLSTPDV